MDNALFGRHFSDYNKSNDKRELCLSSSSFWNILRAIFEYLKPRREYLDVFTQQSHLVVLLWLCVTLAEISKVGK
jgi:hypothetical protein